MSRITNRVVFATEATASTESLNTMSDSPQRPGVTLDHVWLAAAITLILIGPLITPVPPNDLWFHIATGRRIVIEGVIPMTDSFSFTRFGTPFYNQAWLAQLALFGLNQAGGVPLLLIVHALTLLFAYGLLLRLCVRRSGTLRLAVALFLVSLPVAFPDWNIRPQTFAFPLFASFLYILTAYRLGWFNRLWLLPLLMVLWVNIHGSFPLGLALVGATVVGVGARVWGLGAGEPDTSGQGAAVRDQEPGGRGQGTGDRDQEPDTREPEHNSPALQRREPRRVPLRPLLLWGGATALAMLVNPAGIGVLSYVRNLTGNSAVTQLVQEWAPPTIRDGSGVAFFAFLILGGLVIVYTRRKPDLTDWLMTLPLLWLALGAGRNIVWFAFVAVPIIVVAAAGLRSAPRKPATSAGGAPLINGILIGLLGLMVALCLPWFKPLWLDGPQGQLLKNTPVAAIAWLRQQPERPRHLYHTEAHGSFLTYAAPEQPVFIDPRIELYPYRQWADYLTLNEGHDLAPLIAKYDLDGMLLSKQYQAPLIAAIGTQPGWSKGYEDALVVYFARR